MNVQIIPFDIQALLNPTPDSEQLRAQAEALFPCHENLPSKAEYLNLLEAHRLHGLAHMLEKVRDPVRAEGLADAAYGGIAGKAYVDALLRYQFGEDAIERIMARGE